MTAYRVVRADLKADRAAIVDCLGRNEHDMPRVADQVAWHLEQNPHGEGRAWLLLSEPAGKVIGVSGMAMRWMLIEGERRRGGRAWGFSVDKEHRTVGPALQLVKAALGALEDDLSFLYLLPYVKIAKTLFGRVGYKNVASFDRHVRVLRSKNYVQLALGGKEPLLSSSALVRHLATVLAPIADFAIRLGYDRPWEPRPALAIQRVTRFDRRFDDLWARARSRYRLTSERSSEFLAWRFQRSWDTHLVLGFSRPGESELAGYAVLTFDRQQAIVRDLFLEDPATLSGPGLRLLVDWIRTHSYESICLAIVGAAELRQELSRRWFVKRTDRVHPPRPAASSAPRAPVTPPVENGPDELFMLAKGIQLPDPSLWHFFVADDV